jgi:hypothetical protein
MDGPDLSGISRLVMSQFFRPQETRSPECRYADDRSISATCLRKRTDQIFPAFRDLRCLDFLALENPDLTMAAIPMVTLVQLLLDLTTDGYLLKI